MTSTHYQFVAASDPMFLHDVPDILYKFRAWNNPFSQDMLRKGNIFFSPFSRFNDPFDGQVPFRYDPKDLTPENLFLKHIEIAQRVHPGYTPTQLHEAAYAKQQEGRMQDEQLQEEWAKEVTSMLDKEFGVLSLCKTSENFLLWSHYADSHKGFAIGFDKKGLYNDTQAKFGHVHYDDNFPLLGLFEDPVAAFDKLQGTKSKIWEYEKEYRLIKRGYSGKTITVQSSTIAEIVCGCAMQQKQREEIIDLVKNQMPHVRVYEMVKSKKEFLLSKEQRF